jgi:hypothetical protein
LGILFCSSQPECPSLLAFGPLTNSVLTGSEQLALSRVETREAVYATNRKIVQYKKKNDGGRTLAYGEIVLDNKELISR